MKTVIAFILLSCAITTYSQTDSVYVMITGDSVTIRDDNAVENCCLLIQNVVNVLSDTIFVLQRDTAKEYCRCMCSFDFSVTLTGLQPGSYTVVVQRQYTILTPESVYTIGSASFYYGGSAYSEMNFTGYQSPCKTTAVSYNGNTIPRQIALFQNYPNPFNPLTVIGYELSATTYMTLKLYNILGQEVATLVDKREEPGYHSVLWDASDVPAGIYLCRLTTDNSVRMINIIVVK